MTAFSKTSARTHSGFPLTAAVWRGLSNAVALAVTVIRNRAAVRSLGDLDDYLLADIGLTRADLREATAVPLTDDPSRLLAARVNGALDHQARGVPTPRVATDGARPRRWRAS
ncbi:DUF1127 domain-containing protein [Oharaeibacter diazotrophicus]|uniref:Uncharacterized protein DUF1127 n=1 Tax=Oharaeibacter diazotrophicus TaxID=1920512 RepID=A0A4R6RCR7_9HYPH|nr:DUF1127 domain-containing protein [Oharaeibacter diazotrophicus]TDP83497.1 uncharacterized protein DUF1127 [Oharaeibacter diazotrophicus]BBE72330.1 hypothetical protein OHA_1_01920 [Pleomorphomonas sp. SM30]GLS79100.1 hypothetical protein GCM10007904_44370 [Oharaeibacter diazotrophicus]